MSIEYRDGTFSENMDIESAFARFQQEMNEKPSELRAFHIGTEKELDEVKEKTDLQSQIDDLSEKVESMEGVKSDLIDIPTKDQIKAISSGSV